MVAGVKSEPIGGILGNGTVVETVEEKELIPKKFQDAVSYLT
jgi:hypothetical protein